MFFRTREVVNWEEETGKSIADLLDEEGVRQLRHPWGITDEEWEEELREHQQELEGGW